jgi:hypothetical protein
MIFSRIAVLAALVIATSASAVTVTGVGMNNPRPAGQSLLVDWDNPASAGFMSGNFAVVSGSASTYAEPGLNYGQKYLVVPGSGNSGSATLNFVGSPWENWKFTSLSLIWGSVDPSNTVKIWTIGGNEPVVTITGPMIGTASGNQSSLASNRLVNWTWNDPVGISKIDFGSGQIAFEAGDLWAERSMTAAVPEPTTWAMLIVGFGAAGAAMRRRRSTLVRKIA